LIFVDDINLHIIYIVDVSTNVNLQSILTRKVLQEKFQCSICLSTPSHAVITRCSHIFCHKCIRKWFTSGKTSKDPTAKNPTTCPYCRGSLTLNDMFSETKPTTKLEILMQLLRKDTSTKSNAVIFTRYTSTVVFFLLHLRLSGFKTLSCTTNTLPNCDNNIREFENIDGPVVLLVDFQSSRRHRFTINAACRVFLLDACRKTIEDELVACVTQPLCVLRLISQNTIEDKILSLKETFSQTDTFDFYDKEILRYILQEDSM
jgi:SWI/SNF-related matrix-associated actin-dependent regulator of chromatin subfamily A3